MRHYLQNMLLILGILLGACSFRVAAQTPSACGCAFVRNQQLQNVKVQFAGESAAVDAKTDMVVHTGDVIKVTRPVIGSMVCDNVAGTVVLKSTPRTQPVPCLNKPKEGILIGRNGRLFDSRTMSDTTFAAFPIVLSPRSTKLLDARPLLRWTTINNAASYKITVRWNEGSWSTTVPAKSDVQTQEIIYPPPCASGQDTDCASPLKPGESYKLIVEANRRDSEEEGLPNLGFTLLTTTDAQKVRKKAAEIEHLALSGSLKTYMLASFYANNELNADAIAILERDLGSQQNPAAIRLLGDLYLKSGLLHRAETLYLSLLKPDVAALDTPAGSAITHHMLGEIYELLGNTQEAIKYYVEAGKLYRSVNDQKSTTQVENRLSELRAP